jgi:hypothetical protein
MWGYCLFSFPLPPLQKASSVLAKYNGSIIAALMHTFPEIGFEEKKFDLRKSHIHSLNKNKLIDKLNA